MGDSSPRPVAGAGECPRAPPRPLHPHPGRGHRIAVLCRLPQASLLQGPSCLCFPKARPALQVTLRRSPRHPACSVLRDQARDSAVLRGGGGEHGSPPVSCSVPGRSARTEAALGLETGVPRCRAAPSGRAGPGQASGRDRAPHPLVGREARGDLAVPRDRGGAGDTSPDPAARVPGRRCCHDGSAAAPEPAPAGQRPQRPPGGSSAGTALPSTRPWQTHVRQSGAGRPPRDSAGGEDGGTPQRPLQRTGEGARWPAAPQSTGQRGPRGPRSPGHLATGHGTPGSRPGSGAGADAWRPGAAPAPDRPRLSRTWKVPEPGSREASGGARGGDLGASEGGRQPTHTPGLQVTRAG